MGAEVISLDPRTLAEVATSVVTLATRLGASAAGQAIVERMHQKVDMTTALVRDLPRRRVFFAEWLDPPFCAGHWLPEMIEHAGGSDVLGQAGAPSHPTTWGEVTAREPELSPSAPAGSAQRRRPSARRASTFRFPPSSWTGTAITPGRGRGSPTVCSSWRTCFIPALRRTPDCLRFDSTGPQSGRVQLPPTDPPASRSLCSIAASAT